MLILVVGTAGGIGTTKLVCEFLKHSAPALGLDLADGSLSGRLDRNVYTLDTLVFSRRDRLTVIDELVKRRPVLLWNEICTVHPELVWTLIRETAQRIPLIADGGLTPPTGIWELADVQLAVSREGDGVSTWHEKRLRAAHPALRIVSGDLKQAGMALANQLLPKPPAKRFSMSDLLKIRQA